ncbi:MAG: hypothetical protein KDD11_05595, partial [Acidobacteria bacterium]|nr:hypothetical protein [Acidobacteriota bacterium]
MNDPRAQAIKILANDTAERLSRAETSGDGLNLFRRLGLVEPADAPRPAAPDPEPGTVGIWRARDTPDGRRFERIPERSKEWPLWADLPLIEAKGRRRRVVLLGESVARGWFYEPSYTPAKVLETMLSRAGVEGGVEVLDLARTDLDLEGLEALIEPVLLLEPDLVVILGANNWVRCARHPQLADLEGRQRAAQALRSAGVPGLKSVLEEATGELVERHLEHVGRVLGGRGVHCVYLVPEFNLGDWRDDHSGLAPWLAEAGANESWERLRVEALEALERGALDEVETRAQRMAELDGGTSAVAPALLAEVAGRRGDPRGAAALFERARDARIWDGTYPSPRPLSLIQQRLRALPPGGAVTPVDLPAEFRRSLGGEVPDRRLFADYVHLTERGIRVAMAAAARAAAPFLGGRLEAVGLEGDELSPSSEVAAQAHFGAAIHTAHWGQRADAVLHHCRRALAESGAMAEVMRLYLDLQTRRAPVWMCESAERLAKLPDFSLQRYIAKTHLKLFDEVLLGAMATALGEHGRGAVQALDELRRHEVGLRRGRPVDLLEAYYAESWDDRERNWKSKTGTPRFLRAHRSRTGFPLVVDEVGAAPGLELTARTPREGRLGVFIGGRQVAELDTTSRWSSWRLELSPETLAPGLSRLLLTWDGGVGDPEEALAAAAEELEEGHFPGNLLPVFGELYALRLVT